MNKKEECAHLLISFLENEEIMCGVMFNRKVTGGCGKKFTKKEYSELCQKRLKSLGVKREKG